MVNLQAGVDARAVLRAQFKVAHDMLENTIAGCTQEVGGHRIAGATIHTISAVYAHALTGEDFMVNQWARGGRTLLETDGWDTRAGITDVQNLLAVEPGSITFDINILREYAAAVREATDRFLAGASAEDLAREVDSFLGGKIPVAEFLGSFGVTHLSEHCGEIAALKGVQGLKGLPF
jgi:hypothetical protein